MSDKCLYQTDQPEIKEARCIIPIDLKKHGSWFCEFRGKEDKCPVVKAYQQKEKKTCKPHNWEMFSWGGICINCDKEWHFKR